MKRPDDALLRAAKLAAGLARADALLRATDGQRAPWLGPLGAIDVELACLYVAKLLERAGRHVEASALRLDLGDKLIRSALHEEEYPGAVLLGKKMARALGLARGRSGDSPGDLTKKRRSKSG